MGDLLERAARRADPVFEPDRINIVVAGGETNGHFSVFMGSPMRAKFRTNKGQKVAISIDDWR